MTNGTMNKLLLVGLVAGLLTGCGTPTQPDYGYEDPGFSDPGFSDPGFGTTPTTPGFGTTPTTPGFGTTPGYGATPGFGTTPGFGGTPGMGMELTASVISKKNGRLFGMGTFRCTVEVSNPGATPRTGTLTVTFKNGSRTSKMGPVVQQVSLAANETRTFDFQDKAWSTDDVEVFVTTDPAMGGGMGMGGGTPGFGSMTGAQPGFGGTQSPYGAPTGYGTPY